MLRPVVRLLLTGMQGGRVRGVAADNHGHCGGHAGAECAQVCGLPAQPALTRHRYLLKFGEVSLYLGYNALSDFFPQYELKACATGCAACSSPPAAQSSVLAGPVRGSAGGIPGARGCCGPGNSAG